MAGPVLMLSRVSTSPGLIRNGGVVVTIRSLRSTRHLDTVAASTFHIRVGVSANLSHFNIPTRGKMTAVGRVVDLPRVRVRKVCARFTTSKSLAPATLRRRGELFGGILSRLTASNVRVPIHRTTGSIITTYITRAECSFIHLKTKTCKLYARRVNLPLHRVLA